MNDEDELNFFYLTLMRQLPRMFKWVGQDGWRADLVEERLKKLQVEVDYYLEKLEHI